MCEDKRQTVPAIIVPWKQSRVANLFFIRVYSKHTLLQNALSTLILRLNTIFVLIGNLFYTEQIIHIFMALTIIHVRTCIGIYFVCALWPYLNIVV